MISCGIHILTDADLDRIKAKEYARGVERGRIEERQTAPVKQDAAAPLGYVRLPRSSQCLCVGAWTDTEGFNWCCCGMACFGSGPLAPINKGER